MATQYQHRDELLNMLAEHDEDELKIVLQYGEGKERELVFQDVRYENGPRGDKGIIIV